MARPEEKKRYLQKFAGWVIGRYIDFVQYSSRIVTEPADVEAAFDEYGPAILGLWHGQFLLSIHNRPPNFPMDIILARHGDAEFFAQAMTNQDIRLIRGAGAGGRLKDRGGAQAFRLALTALKHGKIIGTVADAPPGPARRAGAGIVRLAKHSGRPIVPYAIATQRYFALNTWSRMTINLPFGKMAVVYGEPIYVPRNASDADLEAFRQQTEAAINETTLRAYALAGADPTRATPLQNGKGKRARLPRSWGLWGYNWITWLAQPMAPLLLSYRERSGREDRSRRGERLGISSQSRPDGPLVWVHAASVGETNAVLPLMDAVRQERPDIRFLLTTGTTTSAKMAADRLAKTDIHQFVPLDSPTFVRRFLDHWRPDFAVFTESDLWPNLVSACAGRGIKLALVNARMSDRSYRRWKWAKQGARCLFGVFDVVLAQNDMMAERFSEFGAERVLSIGNLKMDAPSLPVDRALLGELEKAVNGRPVFLAASTHPGEEDEIGHVHRQLQHQLPNLLTIIAPRHPQRGPSIAEDMKTLGLRVSERSMGLMPSAQTDVYIADTIGELGTLYALAKVVFMGGSLVPRGGQNPVEPIKLGAPVLMGPHWFNFSDACHTLLEHGGMVQVAGRDQLANAAFTLLSDDVEAHKVRNGAQDALASMTGALGRTVDTLREHLPPEKELKRAS